MRKFIRVVATSMLAVAALVPAAANAAGNDLRGAPTLRSIDTHHARLQFTTDRRLTLRNGAAADVRIAFNGGQRVTAIAASGRHGDDYVYSARVSSPTEFRIGAKYAVRFRFGGQSAKVRLVKLNDR